MITSSDPPLPAVAAAYTASPFPPFLHSPTQLAAFGRSFYCRGRRGVSAVRHDRFHDHYFALSPDGTRTTRIIASLLSLVMTFLSLHLMVKHRQAEVADSQWLEAYEKESPAPVGAPKWPTHGRSWADSRAASIRTLAALAACRNSLGSGSGAGGSQRLGWQRSSSCYWPSSLLPGWLRSSSHAAFPLPHRARTFHQGAGGCSRQGVRRQRGRPWFSSLIDVVIAKIIESELAVGHTDDEDQQLGSTIDGRLHRVDELNGTDDRSRCHSPSTADSGQVVDRRVCTDEPAALRPTGSSF